jgi:hypothetical protein
MPPGLRGPGRRSKAPRKLSPVTYRTLSCMVLGTISTMKSFSFATSASDESIVLVAGRQAKCLPA